MKRHSLCSCIAFFLFSFHSFAGDKVVEGWYQEYNSSKKIKAKFSVPFAFLASEPSYKEMEEVIYEWVGGWKRSLKPDAVFEISFTYKGKTTLMRSLTTEFSTLDIPTAIFFRVAVDGPVNLYYYIDQMVVLDPPSTPTGVSKARAVDFVNYVLQRDGEGLLRPRSLHYTEDLSNFFIDCPALVSKIRSGSITDLELIVQEYNQKCGDKRSSVETKNGQLRSVPPNLERQSSDAEGF